MPLRFELLLICSSFLKFIMYLLNRREELKNKKAKVRYILYEKHHGNYTRTSPIG